MNNNLRTECLNINQIYLSNYLPMDKLDKAREEICKDCMFWIISTNCRACLYNTLKNGEKSDWWTNKRA